MVYLKKLNKPGVFEAPLVIRASKRCSQRRYRVRKVMVVLKITAKSGLLLCDAKPFNGFMQGNDMI